LQATNKLGRARQWLAGTVLSACYLCANRAGTGY